MLLIRHLLHHILGFVALVALKFANFVVVVGVVVGVVVVGVVVVGVVHVVSIWYLCKYMYIKY